MNLHSVFEELDKLYESMEEPVKESVEEVAEEAEVEEVLTEAAEEPVEEDEDEIEIVEDEGVEEAPAVDEEVRIVLECSNCGGLKIVAEADANIDEETNLANVGDACQYCEAADDYQIVGSLVPYGAAEEEAAAEEEVVEDEVIEDEVVEEGLLDVDLPISVDVNADGNNVTVGGIS